MDFVSRWRGSSRQLPWVLSAALILLASLAINANGVDRIMPLGDSITRGGGSSGEAGYRRPLYYQLINNHYDVAFSGSLINGNPADFDRDHEGHGSYRADQLRDTIYDWLSAHPADVVLLHIGTNDIAGGNQSVAEVEGILDEIDRWEADFSNPVTVVIAARIALRWNGEDPVTIAFNDSVEAMAIARVASGDNLLLVDMEHALDYPADMRDGVHPNDIGYEKMAAVWYAALTDILEPTNGTNDQVAVTDVVLSATSPDNGTDDDLVCHYTLSSEATQAAVAWLKDGAPLMELYLPMEGGFTNGLVDVSGNSRIVNPIGNPSSAWRPLEGPSSDGAYQFGSAFYLNVGSCFPTSADYSKVAWVKRTGTGSNNILSSSAVPGGHVLYASNSQGFRLSAGQNGSWNIVQDPVPLDTAVWYHVAVTFDYETGAMVLYKDGEVVDADVVSAGLRDVTDPNLQVGAFASSSQWGGLIADVRLFDLVLSPDQVLAQYHGSDTIMAAETETGQDWQAVVTPFSASVAGTPVASNTITIGLAEPWLSDLALEASTPAVTTADDLLCTYVVQGGALTTATAWYRNASPEMILYAPFEGGAANALLDLSGNGNDLTVSGSNPVWGATSGSDGHGAFAFNVGASGQSLSAGETFPTQASYTKVAWVYRTGDGSNNIISGDVAAGGHVFFASTSSQQDHLAAGHNNHFNAVYDDSGPLELDTWYHAAVTFDYVSGEMILYKDGSEVDRATLSPADREMTDATLLVGAFAHSSEWHGYLDDVRVYDRVLSGGQIASLVANGRDRAVAAQTETGDTWYVEVTPFSATAIGPSVVSNALVINPDHLVSPNLYSPHPDSILYNMVPSFEWSISLSPYYGRTVYYELTVALDSSLLFVHTVDSLISPGFSWGDSLEFSEDYYWWVTTWVDTVGGIASASSDTVCFWTWTLGDMNQSHGTDISDLVFLVNYMFKQGPEPYPMKVADIAGDCTVDIADLVYLVNYMFKGGPAPQVPNCP